MNEVKPILKGTVGIVSMGSFISQAPTMYQAQR